LKPYRKYPRDVTAGDVAWFLVLLVAVFAGFALLGKVLGG